MMGISISTFAQSDPGNSTSNYTCTGNRQCVDSAIGYLVVIGISALAAGTIAPHQALLPEDTRMDLSGRLGFSPKKSAFFSFEIGMLPWLQERLGFGYSLKLGRALPGLPDFK